MIRTLGLATLVCVMAGLAQAQGEKMKFEVYKDSKDEVRWRLKSGNGQIVAVASEGYKAKQDATKAIMSIQSGLDKLKFEVFEDMAKEYRWRLKASNGEILAVAGESYKNKADAEKGATFLKDAKSAEVVDGKP